MKKMHYTKNLLQCCHGDGEAPKALILKHMRDELMTSLHCLDSYLDNKRVHFPRFFYVTNAELLSFLSRPDDVSNFENVFKSIFTSIRKLKIEKNRVETPTSLKSSLLASSDLHFDQSSPSIHSKVKSVSNKVVTFDDVIFHVIDLGFTIRGTFTICWKRLWRQRSESRDCCNWRRWRSCRFEWKCKKNHQIFDFQFKFFWRFF